MQRQRLFRVPPLDAPVVALAVRGAGGELETVVALKFQGGLVLEQFHATAVGAGQRFADLPTFAGDAPVVGHHLAPALALLATHGAAPAGPAWDLRELAELLIPESADASLAALASLLPIAAPVAASNAPMGASEGEVHFEAAETSRLIYDALVDRARTLPGGLLARLAGLVAASQSPLSELLSALADAPPLGPLGGPIDSPIGGPMGDISLRALEERLGRPRSLGMPKRPPKPVDPDEVIRLLSADGPLARHIPRYEARPEQLAMVRAVAAALVPRENEDDDTTYQLLVEGGTGIGKSVAYLLPAMLFALRNNVRVVVSTNTISLQEQLIAKDIPDLLAALAEAPDVDVSGFRYAQLKGKANYLCLRRWERMASGESVSADEARTLAKSLTWLQTTPTGDRAELRLRGRELGAWDRISAAGFSTCPGAREGACFYRHARDEAAAAHILVVNHALLLSDLRVEGSLVPEYDFLVIDEAHNLEEEATRQFGFRVTQTAVEELVERLSTTMHSVGAALRVANVEQERKEPVQARLDEAQLPLFHVREHWALLMSGIAGFAADQGPEVGPKGGPEGGPKGGLKSGPKGGPKGGIEEEGELRITSGMRAQPAWSELEIVWDSFESAMADAARGADAVLRAVQSLPGDALPGADDLSGGLVEWFADQGEARSRVASFVAQPDDEMVYWLGRGNGPLSLNGAPLEVAGRLAEGLFSETRSVVLTSATLAVDGGFSHLRGRLGLEDAAELRLGSPFDYQRAALLCLPTDMPEPNAPGYTAAVAGAIEGLARDAGGQTMALFTSHAAVRATAAVLRPHLAAMGIAVLAQGVDGTPPQLLARFQDDPRAVLLGTSSFWEGVDVGNDALKVLVVARLPFNVPTDPIFEARSAQYEQPFVRYAVPQAVLRFRQGFGRLIRNRSDRGAVVVLDGRISSRPYGRSFLNSVPPATVVKTPLQDVLARVREWLADPVLGGAASPGRTPGGAALSGRTIE